MPHHFVNRCLAYAYELLGNLPQGRNGLACTDFAANKIVNLLLNGGQFIHVAKWLIPHSQFVNEVFVSSF